ncbi:hypothetical protein JW710_04710 [Candidatus Dojkabacteria bacterium]|nr:hypothetical protein [Candidatus Dojkabacteria bacterium]
MAIRVNRKTAVIIGVSLFVVLAGVGGFIVWRLNQPREVTPEESEAAECEPPSCEAGGSCHGPGSTAKNKDNGCTYTCVNGSWKNPDCPGSDDDDDDDGEGCEGNEGDYNNGCCERADGSLYCHGDLECIGGTCLPPAVGDDDDDDGGEEYTPSDTHSCSGSSSDPAYGCADVHCEYPYATYCKNGQCQCVKYNVQSGWPAGCTGAPTGPEPAACPAGMTSCTKGTAGCEEYDCQKWECPGCDNPSYKCTYCKTSSSGSNECETGNLDTPAAGSTVPEGQTVRIEGWAADGDGIDTSRIEVTIDGNHVGNATAENACPDRRADVCNAVGEGKHPVAWVYDWVATGQGNHTISVRWWDSEGLTSSDCRDSTNITVSGVSYLQIQGRVFCQDPGGELYPIPGATVTFSKTGGSDETLTTDSDGFYRSAANTTQKSEEPFSVDFGSIPSGTLPTGVDYEDMTGPTLSGTENCPSRCSSCSGTSYSSCSGFSATGINTHFDWQFVDCDLSQPNTEWELEKEGSIVCVEEGTPNVHAIATYVIRVRNIVEGSTGRLLKVENYYDETGVGIQASWITSTTPTATSVDSEKIVWELTGDDQIFEYCGDDTCWREFRYTVRVPRDLFGDTIVDHAIGYPETGEPLHAYEDVVIICGLPISGIMDSFAARLALGGILIALGYLSYRYLYLDKAFLAMGNGVSGFVEGLKFGLSKEGSKSRWEKKVIKSVDKKRRKSKK